MVIAIDGYEANVVSRVGIGRYAFEILKHIYGLVSQNAKFKAQHTLRVYLPSGPLSDMPKETPWWKYRIAKPKVLWTFFGLPRVLMQDKPSANVIFSPTHYVPRYVRTPRVMAIMDLSYLTYPDMFRREDIHKLTYWTAYGVGIAKKILTISQYSKNAIIKAYGVPKENVVVTYPGITMAKPRTHSTSVLEKYSIAKPYILSVGTIQPRKNYVRLIEAFSRLPEKYSGLTLVIVGKKGWLWEETLDAPKRFGVERRVKFLDFVPDKDLPALYGQAECFILVSLYEGFGLPVLEAMAYERPVVVSKVSSIPEIAGDAGIYVDPESAESIVSGLTEALDERGTEKGRERIRVGKTRVKQFSWEKAAKTTLDVLVRVGGKNI